jgi:multidrug efflux system outer membrane protein
MVAAAGMLRTLLSRRSKGSDEHVATSPPMLRIFSSDPMFRWRLLCVAAVMLGLAGCAVGPDYGGAPAVLSASWQTRVPHGGSVHELAAWWQQFDDPVLDALQSAAQTQSPSVAQAVALIEQARAQAQAAGAALAPSLQAGAAAQRGTVVVGTSMILASQANAQAQASWELDVFGRVRREREAATARLASREAAWHEARVTVAAETAVQYLQLRYCQALTALAQADLHARQRVVVLTDQAQGAGLQSAAAAAAAAAQRAEAGQRLEAQRAECVIALKSLVALTGMNEETLRHQIEEHAGALPRPKAFAVASIPADLLVQRPDLAAAERDLAAAHAEIGVAEGDRYPRLVLAGSVGPLHVQAGSVTANVATWSIGPALSVPVFDGGRRRARVVAARAAYQAAQSQFRSRARQAVREVEEALVRLEAAAVREQEVLAVVQGYRQMLAATEARWRHGLASELEWEEARRGLRGAESGALAVQRDRVAAWVALYRALGGGWQAGV